MKSELVKATNHLNIGKGWCNGWIEQPEEIKSGIYCWTCKANSKRYVGQSISLRERKVDFLRFTQPYAGALINKARKHYNQPSQWNYDILEYCNTDVIDEREIQYISECKASDRKKGYNLADGGGGARGYRFSDEAKKRLSEIRKLQHHTEESKRKLSEAKKGKPQPHFNKAIEQFSKDGEFIREWISVSEAAKVLNITLSCISNCLKGRYNSAGGYKWLYKGANPTDEWKQQPIGQQSKRILQIDKDTNKVIRIFEGIAQLVNITKLNKNSINNCLVGRQRQHGGYKWAWEGTELNEEWISQTDEFTRGKILQVDLQTGEIIKVWIRINTAANTLGIEQANISACCRGLRNHAGGFKWEYADK